MVLAIVGTVFAFVYAAMTMGAVAYDADDSRRDTKDKVRYSVKVMFTI
jgi:hypothetical protein